MTDLELFSRYMECMGFPFSPNMGKDKRLGLLNGSHWVGFWAEYFAGRFLPNVDIICGGSDAIQYDFINAYRKGAPCPTPQGIMSFVRMAEELITLGEVDGILITCSTMNRAYPRIMDELNAYNVAILQIDRPMMEKAMELGGEILVVTTHGPTAVSTEMLIGEVTEDFGHSARKITTTEVGDAFYLLSRGDVSGHNAKIANAIRQAQRERDVSCVVLAQLSMAVFELEYPNPKSVFGCPVYNSAREGFGRMEEMLYHNDCI